MLLARIGFQIEQGSGDEWITVDETREIAGVILLEGSEDCGAVRCTRIRPWCAARQRLEWLAADHVQLPAPAAHRADHIALKAEKRLMRAGLFSCEHGPKIAPIDRTIRRCGLTCKREDRGEPIHVYARGRQRLPAGNTARPASDAGHAQPSFSGRSLHAAQTACTAAIVGAVVAGEDDEGALLKTKFDQRGHHPAHAPIQFGDGVAIESGTAFSVKILGGGERFVRHGMCEIEEEGPLALFAQEGECALGVTSRERGLRYRVFDRLFPFDQAHGTHVVAVENAEIGIKTAVRGPGRDLLMPKVPFADHAGGVATPLQQFGQKNFARGKPQGIALRSSIRRGISVEPVVKRIAACEQGSAGGRAKRSRGIEVRETGAFARQSIKLRSAMAGMAVTAQVSVPKIIGQNEHDIGRLGSCRCGHELGAHQSGEHTDQTAQKDSGLSDEKRPRWGHGKHLRKKKRMRTSHFCGMASEVRSRLQLFAVRRCFGSIHPNPKPIPIMKPSSFLAAGFAVIAFAMNPILCAAEDPGAYEFEALSPSAKGRYVEINVQSGLLKFASKVAASQEPDVAELLKNVRQIRVNVVGLDDSNKAASIERIAAIRGDLERKGWEKIVVAREPQKQGSSDVAIYMKSNEDTILGVVVTVIEGKGEAVLVNVVGNIRAEDLARIGEKFDIKPLRHLKRHQKPEAES